MPLVSSVQVALDRLDGAESLGAVVARDDAATLEAARDLERRPVRSPLHGRTITVKDWIDVAGLPCEGESATQQHRMPIHDATAVRRLREAGAIVIAKTQPGATHPIHGVCHHPFDRLRTPGASSSGEAALIGTGASTLGLGSDSGGSIRLPAAWCGVVGIKPSYGLVPTTGHFPSVGGRFDGRTVIGPMASTVADLDAALAVIAGPDGCDPDCVPVPLGDTDGVRSGRLRVVMLAESEAGRAAFSTRAAVERTLTLLERRGADVANEPLHTHLDESLDITERYWRRSTLTGADADRQLFEWDRFSKRMTRAAAGFDVVVGPVVADVAPPARPLTGDDYLFTLPWSLTGWPAISLPMGADPVTGLPLAVQIAAPRWHDHVVLAVARWLESDATV